MRGAKRLYLLISIVRIKNLWRFCVCQGAQPLIYHSRADAQPGEPIMRLICKALAMLIPAKEARLLSVLCDDIQACKT